MCVLILVEEGELDHQKSIPHEKKKKDWLGTVLIHVFLGFRQKIWALKTFYVLLTSVLEFSRLRTDIPFSFTNNHNLFTRQNKQNKIDSFPYKKLCGLVFLGESFILTAMMTLHRDFRARQSLVFSLGGFLNRMLISFETFPPHGNPLSIHFPLPSFGTKPLKTIPLLNPFTRNHGEENNIYWRQSVAGQGRQ